MAMGTAPMLARVLDAKTVEFIAIAAGGILTPPMAACLASLSEEARDNLHQLVPLGRMGKPEEYASLAVYLASDGHHLVGQTISPNGGMIV
jgi:3-oxoacyl-[acyl-carrier protein] reductase